MPLPDRSRHYLDHAATSWPKLPGVLAACVEYQTKIGTAVGRGVYQSAQLASDLLSKTRRSVANLVRAPSEQDIAFCSNGTQALNAALWGLLGSRDMHGCHVVTTQTEHNSVLRPLALAAKRYGIEWTAVECDVEGYVEAKDIERACRDSTKLIAINHASNVTGAVQDIASIASIAQKHQAILLLDAAQSIGYVPIDVNQDGVDILAAPGHKGMGGMLGTGVLYVRKELQSQMEPYWIGGTGTDSDLLEGPFEWQAAVESGNTNLPAIASLQAGLDWLSKHDVSSQMQAWTNQLIEAISRQPSLKLIGPKSPNAKRVAVVSLVSINASCHEMAMLLDSALGVEARSGLHCAGLIHQRLGTAAMGGTLRLSLGHNTTEADIQAALAGIELIGSL